MAAFAGLRGERCGCLSITRPGRNDQPEHAREVLALLAGMKAKVNLIVWNPGPVTCPLFLIHS